MASGFMKSNLNNGCTHEHTIRSHTGTGNLTSCRSAVDASYIAMPYGRCNVGLWSLQDISAKPLELIGHQRQITSLCFGVRGVSTLLCSCGSDYVIIWDIEHMQLAVAEGKQTRGTIIGTTLGTINYCKFNLNAAKVAICVGKLVHILNSMKEELELTLEGHMAVVTCAEFCPHYTSTLVTCGEDRQFKVWDLSGGNLLYQSSIISSSPFISLTMSESQPCFALGTVDGQLRVYDMTDGNGFRLLHHIDVDKTLKRIKQSASANKEAENPDKGPITISSHPSWHTASNPQPMSDDQDSDQSEAGCAIIAIMYIELLTDDARQLATPIPSHLSFLNADKSIANELLNSQTVLIVVTSTAILQYNAKTLAPIAHCNLLEPITSSSLLEESDKFIAAIHSALLVLYEEKVTCIVTGLLGQEVNILRLDIPMIDNESMLSQQLSTATTPNNTEIEQPANDVEELSVLSCAPLLPNSPLKAELILKPPKPQAKKKPKGLPTGQQRASTDDQPLTFHSDIKSSGYTDAPRKDRFQPRINRRNSASNLPPPRARSSSLTKSSKSISIMREYPLDSDPPTSQATKVDVAERPTAISSMKFSGDGQHLACSLANTTTQIFKLPLTGRGRSLTGHNGTITSTQWSHDNKWLITSSDDKSAAVWSMSIPDPLLHIKLIHNNFGADKDGGLKATKDNSAFTLPVKFGQFYYMDKFILLTSGPCLNMYKYHLDTSKNDIKRYVTNNRYKLVRSYNMEQSNLITAFSAVNTFHSYLSFCCGSNRSLDIFDMNVGERVRTITDIHTKAPHTIQHNIGSSFTSNASCNYDLFATAAASDCIKLWDLRSNRCVHRYEGHKNRIHPCGIAFSPCSRFLATGSEDRSAYIYDLRSSTYLHKLMGHTETVGDVAFHPLKPQLVTASLDGKVRLFVVK